MNVKKIRKDFGIVEKYTYFDSSCVSLKPTQVVKEMNRYYEEFPSCGGRSGHQLGRKVTDEVEAARRALRKFFGAKKDHEIIFTRNTTESINVVSNGLSVQKVLTTDKEHNSNLLPWLKLRERGVKHVVVETEEGVLDLDAFTAAVKGVDLVAVNHISNMDGVVNPLKEIVKIAHDAGARVIVDGAQGAGHVPVDVKKLGVDFYACSGHKMLGPSGIGMLYGTSEALEELDTYNLGGDTVVDTWLDKYELAALPERFEAGLQNYAGMIGFAAAAKYLDRIGLKDVEKHSKKLHDQLVSGIQEYNLRILGRTSNSIVSVIPKNMKAHELNLLLDKRKILTRSGTFCCHSYFNKYDVPAAVRFSPYIYNTEEEVGTIKKFFEKDVKELL